MAKVPKGLRDRMTPDQYSKFMSWCMKINHIKRDMKKKGLVIKKKKGLYTNAFLSGMSVEEFVFKNQQHNGPTWLNQLKHRM